MLELKRKINTELGSKKDAFNQTMLELKLKNEMAIRYLEEHF